MRADMGKVVTERPRWDPGVTYGNVRRPRRPDEDRPAVESMRRPYRERKKFSDLLGPLEWFLRSRVGHLWDRVFSEMAENLRLNSMSGDHIRRAHLTQMVDLNPVVVDGQCLQRGRTRDDAPTPFRRGWFYVDQHGVLREGKVGREAYYAQQSRLDDGQRWVETRREVDGKTYVINEGLWCLVEVTHEDVEVQVPVGYLTCGCPGVRRYSRFLVGEVCGTCAMPNTWAKETKVERRPRERRMPLGTAALRSLGLVNGTKTRGHPGEPAYALRLDGAWWVYHKEVPHLRAGGPREQLYRRLSRDEAVTLRLET